MKTQLKKDEKIVLETRPHWFTVALPFVILLAFAILGVVIGGYGLLLIVIAGGYLVYKVYERNNNVWAVTNLRVVDEFGVFTVNSKESPLDKINNVSYTQPFWGKLFGYGDVQIQTAAEIGSTTYRMVENPRRLKDTITNMQEAYKDYQIRKQAEALAGSIVSGQQINKPDVPAELEKLFELKQRGIITEEEFNSRKAKLLNT